MRVPQAARQAVAAVQAQPAGAVTLAFRRSRAHLQGRRFLIVTAPFGGFGPALARALECRGAAVSRMIFNAGDWLNWRRPGAVVFKASPEVWAGEIQARLEPFTDVILFGEGGPYNRAVLSAADALKARVWVLENG